MARWPAIIGSWLCARDAQRLCACRIQDGHLHTDEDAVCPRCLSWIDEDDFVRRTTYGPLQHEVCPAELVPSS